MPSLSRSLKLCTNFRPLSLLISITALTLILVLCHPAGAQQSLKEFTLSCGALAAPEQHYLLRLPDGDFILFVDSFESEADSHAVFGRLAKLNSLSEAASVIQAGIAEDGTLAFASAGPQGQEVVHGKIELIQVDGSTQAQEIVSNNCGITLRPAAPPNMSDFCAVDQLPPDPTPTPQPTITSEPTPASPSFMSAHAVYEAEAARTGTAGKLPLQVSADQPLAAEILMDLSGDDLAEIDILVAYTPNTLSAAGSVSRIEALVRSMIIETNNIFKRSEAGIKLRLVGLLALSQNENGIGIRDLSAITERDGVWDEVFEARTRLGADIVTLLLNDYLRELDGSLQRPLCGLGWIPRPGMPLWARDRSFNVMAALFTGDSRGSCGARVFAHELGHNMGLNHDHFHSAGGAAFDDSYGHRFFANGYLHATVMSYLDSEEWPYGRLINYFSNSDLTVLGEPLGVPNYANEAHSLKRVREFVASHGERQLVNISGQVLNGEAGMPGISLVVNGAIAGRSGPDGRFSLKVPRGAQLSLSAESELRGFEPPQHQLASEEDLSGLNFTLIRDLVQPPSGFYRVVVSAFAGGTEVKDASFYTNYAIIEERDLDGNYFIDLPSGSTHSISAFHPLLNFIPSSATVSGTSGSQSIVFEAMPGANWITGYVWNAANLTVPGVIIDGSDGLVDHTGKSPAVSSSIGFYRFINAESGVEYFLTPKLSGNHFYPPEASILSTGAAERLDFKLIEGAGDLISGKVLDQTSAPVLGANLELRCTSSYGSYGIRRIKSGEDGSFLFSGLPLESVCDITARRAGYQFTQTTSVTSSGSSASVTLIGQHTAARLSGTVLDESGRGVPSISILTEHGSVTTGADGSFYLDVPLNKPVTINPTSSSYYFSPAFYSLTADKEADGFNFIARPVNQENKNISVIGKPIVKQPPLNSNNPNIDIELNYINPTGQFVHVKWQMRSLIKKGGKKVFSKWKNIKGSGNQPKLQLLRAKLKPGTYQVRGVLTVSEKSEKVYTKPVRLKINKVKRSAKRRY
ncbi:MAG: hypothetical protein J5J00_08260 [Deltaproteobacteria bacterium]|nr:hypothetical protein [Deltaproteobacteria bacterium]